jgi:hypothetical protein
MSTPGMCEGARFRSGNDGWVPAGEVAATPAAIGEHQ